MNAKRFLFTLVALAMSAGAALAQYADHTTRLTPPSPSTKSIFTPAQHRAFAAPAETPAAATADDKPQNFFRCGPFYQAGFEYPDQGSFGLSWEGFDPNGWGMSLAIITNAFSVDFDSSIWTYRIGPCRGMYLNDNVALMLPLNLNISKYKDPFDTDKDKYSFGLSFDPTINLIAVGNVGIYGGLNFGIPFASNPKLSCGFTVGVAWMKHHFTRP